MIKFCINQKVGPKIGNQVVKQWLKKIEKVVKPNDFLPKKFKNRVKNHFTLSLAIIGDNEIKRLNWQYRQKDKVTDVLSFSGLSEITLILRLDDFYLGEIIICYPQARRQAKIASWPVKKELELLFVHGFLHLLGLDHEKSEKQARLMKRLEDKIVNLEPAER